MVIAGIDEAGRGCWAGPLVASAVILNPNRPIVGLKDSKKLTRSRREKLAAEIYKKALAVSSGWVTAAQIDKLGLTRATSLAMHQAVKGLNTRTDRIIVDGSYNYLSTYKTALTMIKADSLIDEVSAASIIAKTERDAYMRGIAQDYPDYSFEKHVGYGTALHLASLKRFGACELHRISYKPLKALVD